MQLRPTAGGAPLHLYPIVVRREKAQLPASPAEQPALREASIDSYAQVDASADALGSDVLVGVRVTLGKPPTQAVAHFLLDALQEVPCNRRHALQQRGRSDEIDDGLAVVRVPQHADVRWRALGGDRCDEPVLERPPLQASR